MDTVAACRPILHTKDPNLQLSLAQEIWRLGLQAHAQCPQIINQQDAELAGVVAISLAGAAVAASCANGGFASLSYESSDWDQFYNNYGDLEHFRRV